MSKRNFILLIIFLIIAVLAVFGFLFSKQWTGPTSNNYGDTGTNFITKFNPFGSRKTNPPVTKPPVDISGYVPPPTTKSQTEKLIKVSSMPVAGFTIFSKERLKAVPIENNPSLALPLSGEGVPPVKEGSGGLKKTKTPAPTAPLTEFVEAIRYVAKKTGFVYQSFLDKIEERQFSSNTIPKVYDAYFGNKGQSVVMRYLKIYDRTIETFVGNLPKEYLGADTTANNEIKGTFLPNNITDLSISPDNTKIFYLFSSGDSIIGTVLNLSDNKKVQVFDSFFTEWTSLWSGMNNISLTTKPDSSVLGYMYNLDLNKKNLVKVLGDVSGFTTLTSPDGKNILYGGNNLSLNNYNTISKNKVSFSLKTLPEKCTWSGNDIVYCAVPKEISGSAYPESWYQGEVSFNDQIWKLDIKNGNTTLVIDPSLNGGEEIDGTKLAVDPIEENLFFVNKKDSFLWKLSLK